MSIFLFLSLFLDSSDSMLHITCFSQFLFFSCCSSLHSFSRLPAASHYNVRIWYGIYSSNTLHIDVVSLSNDDDDHNALLSLRQSHSQNMHIKINLWFGVPIRCRANKKNSVRWNYTCTSSVGLFFGTSLPTWTNRKSWQIVNGNFSWWTFFLMNV